MRFNSFFIALSLRRLALFIPVLFCFPAMAQLRADFNMDKTGGCSPLTVSFTNTSSGVNASTTYEWDFGNGNTSSLQQAGAVFFEEKAYTVKLTVRNGSETAVQTKTITVYKKPAIDFTVSPDHGCSIFPVTFTGTAIGDGTITNWQWDFGDGFTQQSSSPSIVHAYTFEQKPVISVTAINNYGCAGTVTKRNIVTVFKELVVDFISDRTIACNAPAAIQFTNRSTGSGVLTYQWDFGDGNTSTQLSPQHTYTRRGTFTVKLTVTTSDGCARTSAKTAYINVEDFVTDFTVPALLCSQRTATFNNLSTPLPDESRWIIDGNPAFSSYNNQPVSYFFANEGTHTVELINTFETCQHSIIKQIEVKKTPVLNGFVIDIAGLCGAPLQVNFKDTSSVAVAWKWNFDWWADNSTVHSTVQAPSYTYTQDNNYQVSLTIFDAAGCSETVLKPVGISRPLIGIFLPPDANSQGCLPLTVPFTVRTTDPIVSYEWNFGDGNTSTDPSPVHTFTQAGDFNVTLKYKTANGCTGTQVYNNIRVFTKPKADFTSLSGTTICGNSFTSFQSSSTGSITDEIWYANGAFIGNGSYSQFNYQFQQEGDYTMQLIVRNSGCSDTLIKTNYIKVLPPFPKIASIKNICDGNRDLVTLTEASRLASSWRWDFGDGTSASYTTAQPAIDHVYPKTGQYKVMLTVTNGGCTLKDSATVYVLLKQHPQMTTQQATICNDGSLSYVLSNLETNPYSGVWVSYLFERWEYGNGAPFTGNYSNDFNFVNPLPYNGTLQNFDRTQDKIRVIVESNYFGCADTSNYIPLSFKGPKSGFEIITDNLCFKSIVTLKDTSVATGGFPILSWTWDFGDGVIETNTQGGIVNHKYANPGIYNVILKVTDASGCTSTASSSRYVQVTGPKASFGSSGTNVQLNTTVNFYNTSNTYNAPNVNWLWNFGNGITSTAYSPSYTYTVAGDYVVILITENTTTQCRDTAKLLITVRDFNTGFTSNYSFIGNYNQCPPVLARFFNTSTNYTKLVWDFGDGSTLEDHYAPAHMYNAPGQYIIVLKVYGFNGLTGTFRDTLNVGQPVASIRADDIEGCIGHTVALNAPVHTDATSYLWDFGNGYIANRTDSFATHQFMNAGTYTASLVVQDAGGCRAAVTLTDKITIHPNPVATVLPVNPIACKNIPVALHASGGSSYEWTPANGLSDNEVASPLALPAATTFYEVQVTDNNGCKAVSNVTVTVPKSFRLNTTTAINLCTGSTVQLTVTGAQTYQWINTTTGLSSTVVSNPVASPLQSTLYTVVGYDQYQCYTDTVPVQVNMRSLPSVNAGADRQVIYGSENRLNASASADVVRWNWSPADYLNCTTCPAPVSKPYAPVDYVVTVYNSYNCKATDTISIKASCSGNGIYIPDAFTPNHDTKNDLFAIGGYGVSLIHSFTIYNRWGEIVFARKNFVPGDAGSAWDGRLKGIDAPAGVYVYFVEMECGSGEKFERKGTVTLVR